MNDRETTVRAGTDLLAEPGWDIFASGAGTVFHLSRFLLPWWQDRSAKQPASRLFVVRVDDATATTGQCAFELSDDVLRFAGGSDVVDYMGPAAAAGQEKDVATALADVIFDRLSWHRAHLAGLIANDTMTRCLIDELLRRSPSATVSVPDRSPRIRTAPQGYLGHLNAKYRGEILRKRKRLREAVGDVQVVPATGATWPAALDRLLAWKSEATPAARHFVGAYGDFVREMFAGLDAVGAAQVVELHAGDRPLASAIVFSHRGTRYLYNMSYDLAVTAAATTGIAPGVVLVSYLAEQALDTGWEFDFLKGTQDYKLRLGGVPEDLLTIELNR